ncbi:MAG: single-stranded DNA-binding protein [Acidobacteria bacterium]|nr:single-stranded DNA-binding protein [Acidobacteriota bacterium]
MPRSVNKVILIGNLGKDAETKFTAQGTAVSKFSIATTRRVKDNSTGDWKDETDWSNVVLFKNEGVAQYLTKGKQVYVEGRLSNRSYDDKDGNKRYVTEVIAEEVMLLGGRGGDSGEGGGGMVSAPRSAMQPRNAPAGNAAKPAGNYDDFDPGISDDDVPF